ncbi:MAG: hypothetical protein A3F67_08075 [Verrucomicrobia bacterium RIFCSPHIGHO2_12_FULL_41_10]|nr:MAG: hypothetical protein A3F67_08075 [Verrucomicrobia bacterium RIFCSPHIGHO2_12_FULL_41_10]
MIEQMLVGVDLIKITIFITAGLSGMLYAYMWKWVDLPPNSQTLTEFLFGNTKNTLRALLVFVGCVAGTLSLDYISHLDYIHLLVAGVGVGLLIPGKVEETKHGKV